MYMMKGFKKWITQTILIFHREKIYSAQNGVNGSFLGSKSTLNYSLNLFIRFF